MSYCKESGKDRVIFATEEDLSEPSKAIINEDEDGEDQQPGLILPNGDINWDCPCLGGMATGPCGVEFREAFSCFHYSEAEPKGSDCYGAFLTMQNCMSEYPEVYPPSKPSEMESDSGPPVAAAMGMEGDGLTSSNNNNDDSPGLITVLTSNSEESESVGGVESRS